MSFSANYWDELDEGQYSLLARARTGEVLLLYVDGEPEYWNGDYHAYGVVTGGSYGSDYWYVEAQRSSFQKSGKDYEHPEAIDLAKAMQGTFKFNATYNGNGEYKLVQSADKSATLSVAVKNTGAVAVSGTIPGTSYKASCSGMLRVYPLNSEATILACGASGKTVSIMIVLDAVLDENGNVLMTGFANVNPMQ